MFLESLVKFGAKTESTPGTAASPTASEYNLMCEGIGYSYEIQMADRKYATGSFSPFSSLPGTQMFNCTVKFPLQGSGTAGTAPKNDVILKALGLKHVNVAATSDTYTPHTDGALQTVTIHVAEQDEAASPVSIRMGGKGMMGTGKLEVGGIGKPAYVTCDFKGAAIDPADVAFGSIITPGSFDTTKPPVMLSATITMFSGEVLELDKFTLDLGNVLSEQVDPSDATGILLYSITDRKAMMSVDPYLRTIAARANYGRFKSGTTGTLSLVLGSAAGNIITITAPAVQIIKGYTRGARNGKAVNSMELLMTRSSGNDEFSVAFT
jgi:ribosomal protein L30/L7E